MCLTRKKAIAPECVQGMQCQNVVIVPRFKDNIEMWEKKNKKGHSIKVEDPNLIAFPPSPPNRHFMVFNTILRFGKCGHLRELRGRWLSICFL